jgi:hypothetical protein
LLLAVKLATFYSNWYTGTNKQIEFEQMECEGKNCVEKGPKWPGTRGYRAKQMRIETVGESRRKYKKKAKPRGVSA